MSVAGIGLPHPTSQAGPTLLPCPSRHVTHDFLACDARSQCWAPHAPSSASPCRAPLASLLPPHFVCGDGAGSVPYPLVCDHRQDCGDSSDEQFCLFRPCARTQDFRCNNGQVGLQRVRVVGTLIAQR